MFGTLAQELGRHAVAVDVPSPVTVQAVTHALARLFPARATLFEQARIAINSAFAQPDDAVHPGDEVAVIELVGGG